jgi:acyl-CoA thioesterase-1
VSWSTLSILKEELELGKVVNDQSSEKGPLSAVGRQLQSVAALNWQLTTDKLGNLFWHTSMKVVICIFSLFLNTVMVRASQVTATGSSERVVLCLGDSLTAGYGLDASQAYPALLQKKIDALGWGFKVVNAGLSGETTAGGLRRLDWLLKRKIEVMVLALGANDALRGVPPEATEKNLDAILARTRNRYPEVRFVLAGMVTPPNWGREYFNQFRALFPKLAKKHQAQLIPFLLEGVGGRAELNFPDGIHPTAEGYKTVAENVWRALKPVLNAMQ